MRIFSTSVLRAWEQSGLAPRSEKLFEWCLENTVNQLTLRTDLQRIRELTKVHMSKGKEIEILGEIMQLASKHGPSATIIREEQGDGNASIEIQNCAICGRKASKVSTLPFLHHGAVLTSLNARIKLGLEVAQHAKQAGPQKIKKEVSEYIDYDDSEQSGDELVPEECDEELPRIKSEYQDDDEEEIVYYEEEEEESEA